MSQDLDFDFNKFIDDIVIREETQKDRVTDWQKDQDTHPSRIYNKLYRELPQNRIKWVKR